MVGPVLHCEQIREAIGYGVVKMNLDTDMQWAFWDGVHGYYKTNKDYLQGQLGNPEGDDKPNKKFYDPLYGCVLVKLLLLKG